MPILSFTLQNDTVNDADEVMQLLQELEAVLDGGITTANLASGFQLDAQTQLVNNKQEIVLKLRHVFSSTLATGVKDYAALVSGDYTIRAARITYQMTNGSGAPSGSPATVGVEVLAGSFTSGAYVTASTAMSETTFYTAQTQGGNPAGTLSTVSQSGPKTFALNVTQIPATNPPTSGFINVELYLTRLLQ